MLGVGALVAVSIWQYLTFRYRIADDRLIVRSGLLERSVRQIPYSRIHNVAIHQSLLHRLIGVAEVRLESAGGTKPEAEMRVLRLPEALALEQLIRDRSSEPTPAAADGAAPVAPAGTTLLALSTVEVVKLGLISNRGMIVVAGAVALSFQVLPERTMGRWLVEGGREAFGYASGFATTWLAKGLVLAAFVAIALALIRAFSVVLAVVRYHGFRLQRQGRRLTVERGLLSRSRSSVPRRRIQAWTLRESLLHRLFARRTLEIDTASARAGDGQGNANGQRGLDALAPIAPPVTCDAILRDVAALPAWPPAEWRPLHARAWLRLLLGDVVLTALLCGVLAWFFQWWGRWACCGCRGRHSSPAAMPRAPATQWTTRWWPCARAGGAGTGGWPRSASCRRWNCAARRWTAASAWPRCGWTPPARARWPRRCACVTCRSTTPRGSTRSWRPRSRDGR